MRWHSLANPGVFLRVSERMLPFIAVLAGLLTVVGLALALFLSPADYQQGQMVRVMYVHVPAAWMGMGIYVGMALASASYLIWRHPLADIAARMSAPLGAGFTLLCILTGMLWGKPMWGAWWVWDARLTSVAVLLFLYIGYMALADTLENSERNRKACAILALVGLVNIPVIKFSVEWWNTLHQPASVIRGQGPAIHDSLMLAALFTMGAAFMLLYFFMLLLRMRAELMRIKAARLL